MYANNVHNTHDPLTTLNYLIRHNTPHHSVQDGGGSVGHGDVRVDVIVQLLAKVLPVCICV